MPVQHFEDWKADLIERERSWEPKHRTVQVGAGIVWYVITALVVGGAIWYLKH